MSITCLNKALNRPQNETSQAHLISITICEAARINGKQSLSMNKRVTWRNNVKNVHIYSVIVELKHSLSINNWLIDRRAATNVMATQETAMQRRRGQEEEKTVLK